MTTSFFIVVPTFDSYLLLPRLVGSLKHQSWPYWRVLFVDGPSCFEHREWLNDCCALDSRFSWIEQSSLSPGIFGAMNQGSAYATSDEWLLFWGSDDWAASNNVFSLLSNFINSSAHSPDLLVCEGRYADAINLSLGRIARFRPPGLLDSFLFRRSLWLGLTPPHQSTLFAPKALNKISHYCSDLYLSADLDYFLKISLYRDLCIYCLDLELVHMADGGISGKQTKRRLQEVNIAYRRAFGLSWWFPFFARYVRRLFTLFQTWF